MGARKYLFRKILSAFATLLFILTFNFFLFRIVGDPVDSMSRNQKLNRAEQAELREEFGLEGSLPEQYLLYIKETAQFNLGLTFKSGQPVAATIRDRLWPTLLLVGTATVLSTSIGIWLGIRGAWRRGSRFDKTSMVGGMFFYSTPDFWIAMILLMVFAAGLGWFPVAGYSDYDSEGFAHWVDVAHHLFLPMMTLTIGYLAEYQLIMRGTLIEVMGEDYIAIARAKGLQEKAVRRQHAIPNAMLPIVTVIILYAAFIMGGSVGVETVFSYPGLGLLTFQAVTDLDFPMMQGLFLFASAAIIFGNLIADIIYGYLDPRVRAA